MVAWYEVLHGNGVWLFLQPSGAPTGSSISVFVWGIGEVFLANVNSRSCSLFAVARPSVVCLSSVAFVCPTQAVQIFGNISTALGTLGIH